MKILKKYFILEIFLAAFIMTGSQAQAALRCESIFGDEASTGKVWSPPPTLKAYAGELNPQRLARYGFKVEADGTIYDMKHPKGKIKIGVLRTVTAEYLFEWEEKSLSEEWIKAGRIDYMDSILEARGQMSGKGYYVSLDPFDSAGYGTNLTSFRQTKPIMVFNFDMLDGDIFLRLSSNTAFVRRLSKAGVDALQEVAHGFNSTWLSVISERVLKNASGFPEGVMDGYLKTYASDTEKMRQAIWNIEKVPRETLRQLPESNLYRRFFLSEEMSAHEIKYVLQNLPLGAEEAFTKLFLKRLKQVLNSAQTLTESVEALSLFRSSTVLIFSEIVKNYSEEDLKKLKEFDRSMKKIEPIIKHSNYIIGATTRARAEVLRNWILDASNKEETTARTQQSIQTILESHNALKRSPP